MLTMRRLLRCVVVALAALFVGRTNASADTRLIQDGEGGWTKITSLPSQLSDYYFVFTDNSQDLMLGVAKGVNQNTKWYSLGVYYQSSVEPTTSGILSKTWTIETVGNGYALRNLEYSVSPFQTEWNAAWKYDTNDVYDTANEWCMVLLAYSDGCWTIQNGRYQSSGYLGPWNDGNFTNGAECAANKSGSNIGKFQIYAILRSRFQQNLMDAASASNPVDVTPFYVTNATFDHNRSGWTEEGSGGNNNTSLGCEIWHRSSFNIYQDVTLPDGAYKVSLQMAGSTSGTVYGQSGDVSKEAASSAAAKDNFQNTVLQMITDRTYGQTFTDVIPVVGNSLRIGFKDATSNQWDVFDNFKLYYWGPTVGSAAVALPSDALLADRWYYFDVPSEGDYTLAAGSALSDFVYTTDGTQLAETATSMSWSNEVQTLAAGRYYVKSATAQTLSVVPNTYSYLVGSATADIQFVQGGELVTVTYDRAATNDPSAAFAMQATPLVRFGEANAGASAQTVTVTATENGFTFTVPSSLSVATDYELTIPAGAFGYAAGDTYNEAQTISFHTPALLDGTYFFSSDDGRFWMRGEPYGSAVQLYDWGLPVNVVTDGQGATTLKFADASDWLIFSDGTGVYADNANPANKSWRVTLGNGKYTFQNVENGNYMKADGSRVLSTANPSEAASFNCVSIAEHRAVLTGLVNSQASAAASAASLTASTPAELEEAAEAAGWVSQEIVEANTPATTAEKFQGGQWDNRKVFSGTVTISTPGLYRFTMQGFYRMSDNATTYALHAAGADCPPVYVFFGDAKTPMASVFDASNESSNNCYKGADGKFYPDGQSSALTAFQDDHYVNTVWAYISEPGEYQYGIQYLGWAGAHSEWCCYTTESVSVTLYSSGGIYVSDGVVTVLGSASVTDINEALTADISVLNLENASGLSNVDISTENNPNLLIYTASANQVSNHKNVIASGSCPYFSLVKTNTAFIVPKAFTAISANYEVKSADLAGGQFATLMIPFAASGNAYVLNQEIVFSDATVKGTAVTTIPQNAPVLVKTAQTLTASQVTIPVIARGATFTNGKLCGVYTPTKAVENSYVLQNHASGSGVAFYRVNGTQPTVNPFRAYLNASVGEAKAIYVSFDDATGISLEQDMSTGVEAIYTTDGIRLQAPQKGVNILKMKDGSVRKLIKK